MSREKILVVDDSPTERRIVAASLQSRGYTVVTAADGDEALEKAGSEHPRLIVLDVVMPRKNGFQVCRQLKQAEATRDIKILILSNKGEENDRYWGLKQGADGYMVKPFSDQEFLAAVGQML